MSAQSNRWRASLNRNYAGVSPAISCSDRLFREKYGMTLQEFEAAEIVKARAYAFDVENDHQDWDLAVDGIRTVERQLNALRGEE